MNIIDDTQILYPGRIVKMCQLNEYNDVSTEKFYIILGIKTVKRKSIILSKNLENNLNSLFYHEYYRTKENGLAFFDENVVCDDFSIQQFPCKYYDFELLSIEQEYTKLLFRDHTLLRTPQFINNKMIKSLLNK